MNMVLGEVEETVTTMEVDEETFEEMIKVTHPSRLRAPIYDLLHPNFLRTTDHRRCTLPFTRGACHPTCSKRSERLRCSLSVGMASSSCRHR